MMLSLQLLIVFSAALSTHQQVEKDCDSLILDYNRDLNDNLLQCTQADAVQIFVVRAKSYKTLASLNSLRIIDSSNVTARHFVSLNIQSTILVYYPETFLPNLTKIIPPPDSTASAIIIRGNPIFCLPENVTTKLLNMVDGQGYIQPCSCITYLNREGITASIYGGDDCRILNGHLVFVGDTVMTDVMRKRLENVEELHGFIVFKNTNFTSFDFLKNLKKVYYPARMEEGDIVAIYGNENLTELGFTLDVVRDQKEIASRESSVIYIRDNPQLWLSPIEREYYKSFILSEIDFTSIHRPVLLGHSACILVEPISKNIDSIDECESVKGDLTIDNSFDHYSTKEMDHIFGDLRVLHGCLTIRGTKLTKLTFFHDLFMVVCLKERPAVIIEDNLKLEVLDVQIYEFKNSKNPVTVKIKNNPKLCSKEVDYLKTLVEWDAPWRSIDFDRWDEKCRSPRNSYLVYYHIVVAGILAAGMVILEIVVRLIQRRQKKRL